MRKILKTSICEMVPCVKPATEIVWNRNHKRVMLCCEAHAEEVESIDDPEYNHECENCGCRLPIN